MKGDARKRTSPAALKNVPGIGQNIAGCVAGGADPENRSGRIRLLENSAGGIQIPEILLLGQEKIGFVQNLVICHFSPVALRNGTHQILPVPQRRKSRPPPLPGEIRLVTLHKFRLPIEPLRKTMLNGRLTGGKLEEHPAQINQQTQSGRLRTLNHAVAVPPFEPSLLGFQKPPDKRISAVPHPKKGETGLGKDPQFALRDILYGGERQRTVDPEIHRQLSRRSPYPGRNGQILENPRRLLPFHFHRETVKIVPPGKRNFNRKYGPLPRRNRGVFPFLPAGASGKDRAQFRTDADPLFLRSVIENLELRGKSFPGRETEILLLRFQIGAERRRALRIAERSEPQSGKRESHLLRGRFQDPESAPSVLRRWNKPEGILFPPVGKRQLKARSGTGPDIFRNGQGIPVPTALRPEAQFIGLSAFHGNRGQKESHSALRRSGKGNCPAPRRFRKTRKTGSGMKIVSQMVSGKSVPEIRIRQKIFRLQSHGGSKQEQTKNEATHFLTLPSMKWSSPPPGSGRREFRLLPDRHSAEGTQEKHGSEPPYDHQ